MKVKLSATVPVVQYGNLMPEVEVEADTVEDAFAQAEAYILKFWNKYVEGGKELRGLSTDRKKLRAFVGGDIFYDEALHQYSNESGEIYLSGSVYAEQFKEPFDKQAIAERMAKKSNANPDEIIRLWQLIGDASRDFGSAIHKAMQLYEQFQALAQKLGKDSHIHSNYLLKQVVEAFYKEPREKALSEVLVVDHKAKRAGQIDRLEILGERHARVTDFKTGDVSKNLDVYFKQLEFYGDILRADGWEVESPIIYGWNGGWSDYKQAVVNDPPKGVEPKIPRQVPDGGGSRPATQGKGRLRDVGDNSGVHES